MKALVTTEGHVLRSLSSVREAWVSRVLRQQEFPRDAQHLAAWEINAPTLSVSVAPTAAPCLGVASSQGAWAAHLELSSRSRKRKQKQVSPGCCSVLVSPWKACPDCICDLISASPSQL